MAEESEFELADDFPKRPVSYKVVNPVGTESLNPVRSAKQSAVFGILCLAVRITRIWRESGTPVPRESWARRGSTASLADFSLFEIWGGVRSL